MLKKTELGKIHRERSISKDSKMELVTSWPINSQRSSETHCPLFEVTLLLIRVTSSGILVVSKLRVGISLFQTFHELLRIFGAFSPGNNAESVHFEWILERFGRNISHGNLFWKLLKMGPVANK